MKSEDVRNSQLQSFYRTQARIYDLNRWCFLFGRRRLLATAASIQTPRLVLEVGCGTGTNLKYLAKCLPEAKLIGVDLSVDMLRIAERKLRPWRSRIELHQCAFDSGFRPAQNPDLIVFSYSLSMMNPGWEPALSLAAEILHEGGLIAVVDFDSSPLRFFNWGMHKCHVRLDGHLLPVLNMKFTPEKISRQRAYAGMWRYFLFVGRVAK